MIKLKIEEIKEYNNYILEDGDNKIYNINIEFLGDKIPKVNDYIYVPDKILQEINIYTYGPLNSNYSKNVNTTEELIKVVTETEEYYLQRYYG